MLLKYISFDNVYIFRIYIFELCLNLNLLVLGGQSMVRVCKRNSKVKSLIRHFSGQVVDIAWAYTSSPCLLGCTDEGGNLAVYEITVAVNSDEITV